MKIRHCLTHFLNGALGVALVALALAGTPAAAQQGVKVGTLRCDVAGGVGLIIASKKDMICNFRSSRGGNETYSGTIRKFGLDVGATRGGTIIWAVFAPQSGRSAGALAGDYAGASAEATVVAGVGVNVLVGGLDRSFSLQPVSISGQQGLNLALGVTDLSLRWIR